MISCGQNQNFLSVPPEWCLTLILFCFVFFFFTQIERLCLAALGKPWPLSVIPHSAGTALGWNVAGVGVGTATPWAKGLRMGSTGGANTWIYLLQHLPKRPLASLILWSHGLRSTASSEMTLILPIFIQRFKRFFKKRFIGFIYIKGFLKGPRLHQHQNTGKFNIRSWR